jgi:hypothetical protein
LIGEEQARAFHYSVVQLFFATTRSRKDIQHTVAFLATRVKSSDEDDWMKLKRLLKYIRGTIYKPLILNADSLNIVKWWVDESYATHGYFRDHTGAAMSIGTEPITGISKKQKSNKRSSTKRSSWASTRRRHKCYRRDTSSKHRDTNLRNRS